MGLGGVYVLHGSFDLIRNDIHPAVRVLSSEVVVELPVVQVSCDIVRRLTHVRLVQPELRRQHLEVDVRYDLRHQVAEDHVTHRVAQERVEPVLTVRRGREPPSTPWEGRDGLVEERSAQGVGLVTDDDTEPTNHLRRDGVLQGTYR